MIKLQRIEVSHWPTFERLLRAIVKQDSKLNNDEREQKKNIFISAKILNAIFIL